MFAQISFGAIALIALALVGAAALIVVVRSSVAYERETNARIARGKALLVTHGIVDVDDDPWGVDVDFANELLDARAAHPDAHLFVRAVSGASIGRFDSNADVLAERHGFDDMGCIPFCGALLVPGLGVGTPRGFVPADSVDAEAVWSEYVRLIDRVVTLNAAAEKLCRQAIETIEAGGIAPDGVLTAAAYSPSAGGRLVAGPPVVRTVR